ncbi:hypothetical protein EGW08_002354 [Elysia chlorotica]|uniref:B-cell lymphoma 9 beta-catenin binding domain-containing protein n=1 Tax=Elysia chlorotica TaxID=188477 RepID=A0A3S0ZZH4_ELYCH|nr:hypothetical protein EGW08_002354 [Elysia chlorotica]
MKERVDATKMLSGPPEVAAVQGGPLSKLDAADIKMEAKEDESGRKSSDSRPPSRKIPNGDSDAVSVKSEDNNNKRIKLEKKTDNGKLATENGKPGSVGQPDSRKSSPHTPQPASLNTHGPGSNPSTPSSMLGCGGPVGANTPQLQQQQQQQQHQQMLHQPQAGLVTSHEPPFMQQQSEIFVFSTALANQAAEGVRMGQCKTIIQFHMEHPSTKAFLQVGLSGPVWSGHMEHPSTKAFLQEVTRFESWSGHMEHPSTKAFLQKNPLKSTNFRFAGPHGGMMAGMKGPSQMGSGMVRMPGPTWGPQGPEDPSMMGPGGPAGMMPNGQYMGPRMMGGGGGGGPGGGGGWGGGPPHNVMPGMGPGGCYPGGGPSMMDIESEMMMGGPGGMMAANNNNNNPLSVSQVPDENLTMEQRQHRSKGLAQLTKIHQMLMGGAGGNNGPSGGPNGQPGPGGCPPMSQQPMGGPDGGMYPGPHGMMTSQHQAMMQQQQHQAMMSQGGGGMMPPHPGMMSPQQQQQHQHMMAQQGMSPYGPRGPPGMGHPGMNGKDQPPSPCPCCPPSFSPTPSLPPTLTLGLPLQFQAQHDWYQIQRDFYLEKQHRMQQMVAAGRPVPPHMEPGPPPSYYSSISQKHGGMGMPGGPPSPGAMNGMRMPMGPHGPPPHMGMEGPEGMYGPPPPHMGMEPMPGMYPPHGMPPQGPMDPGFDPTIPGSMPPGMVGPGGGPIRHHGPMRPGPPGHMMGGPNGMIPAGMKPGGLPANVTLHRAGNPEQFNPETMGGVVPPPSSNSSKPPPSYAQAQKRKRGDDGDESGSYAKGNLQQTPSPTKIHYHLSQFEGQELTITKQLNTAFVGDDMSTTNSGTVTTSSMPNNSGNTGGPHNFNSHNSPLHGGPGSNKGPQSNSSQASMHNSPSVPPTGHSGPSPHHHPGPPTPLSSSSSAPPPACSGGGLRLSHFDPAGCPGSLSNGISSAPHTPNPKLSSSSSTLSNITSASLANLAKGVENLSNQMQQNMMQGGPFHSIQVQGQMSSTGNGGGNNSSNSNGSNSNSSISCPPTTTSVTTSSSSLSSHPPSSSLSTSLSSVIPPMSSSAPSSHPPPPSQSPNMNNMPNTGYMNMNSSGVPHPMNSYHPLPPGMVGPGGCEMPGMPNGPRPPTPLSHHAQMAQTQGMLAAAALGPMGSGGGAPSPGMQGPHSMGPHPMGGGPQHPPVSSQHQMVMGGPPQQQHMGAPPSHMGGPQQPQLANMGGPGLPPHPHRHNSSSSLPATPPIMTKPGQFTSPPLPHGQMPGMTGVPSPSFPPATSASASSSGPSVQIQQKGQNTIQYLPANPPASSSSSTSMSSGMPQHHHPMVSMGGNGLGPKHGPEMSDYGMPRFPSPMHGGMNDGGAGKGHQGSSTLQYFPASSPSAHRGGPMSSAMSAAAAMGPEFANQAAIAMQQSASMMRSSSIPDLHTMSGMPGPQGHMDNNGGMLGPGGGPMMGGPGMPDMGHGGPMRPGHSPMRSMHPGMPLECVSPIPGMGGYMGGPSIEQAQAQAQAHAAMMMQGGPQMPASSPHMPPHGGPSPHLPPHGGPPMHSGGPMPGHSPHNGGPMPVHSPHLGPMPGQSPHSQMPCSMAGPSPHLSMPPGGGPPHPHSSMAGPMGHMGQGPPMHGPPGGMPRHPGMGSMMGPGPGMYGGPGGMQPGYHGYQPEYYPSGPPRGPPRQMMGPGMMPGPGGQPYGMMSNMPGPS